MEKDSVRGGDALETFKEILSIAKRQNVREINLMCGWGGRHGNHELNG